MTFEIEGFKREIKKRQLLPVLKLKTGPVLSDPLNQNFKSIVSCS